MTAKRFKRYLLDGGFWFEEYVEPVWTITDRLDKNSPITHIEFKDEYKDLCDEVVDLLNELHEENEHYKSIFLELVETALTDKNCRELYCKGILDIFDKANSLNQAREMIKGHLK